MSPLPPSKVLIAGGKPAGGIASFADALACGFTELGIPVEVAAPAQILHRLRELRDPAILKILSLASVFAAPIARRAICVAHGFPCSRYQGWPTALGVLASMRLATACKGAQLVAVSDYSDVHLRAIFGICADAVIRNPVNPMFMENEPAANVQRKAIVYVGRLHKSKNVEKLLPAMRDTLDENPGLRAWIVGDGPLRPMLELMAAGDHRIEFLGNLTPFEVRGRLRSSLVFVSACPHEALGIVYLEALSQGCAIAMPANGGGLEIAPELIGSRIQLFPASVKREGVSSALRKGLLVASQAYPLNAYSARAVAESYLAADAHFDTRGTFLSKGAR